MFNPKDLPAIKEKYKKLLDVSNIALTSTDRSVLYTSYFSLIDRINQMGAFEKEVNLSIDDVKPFMLTRIKRSKNSYMVVIKY